MFSVVANNNTNDPWKLVELSILIPLGPEPASKDARCFRMNGSSGPGMTMLSNLRFNVLVSLVTPGNNQYLQLRLLLRAKDGWLSIKKVEDISFLLALVNINRWPGGKEMQQIMIQTQAFSLPT